MGWRKDTEYTPKAYWFEFVSEARYVWNRPSRILGWGLFYGVSCIIALFFTSLVWAVFASSWAEPSWPLFWLSGLPLLAALFFADMHLCIRTHGHRSSLEETRFTNWRNRV